VPPTPAHSSFVGAIVYFSAYFQEVQDASPAAVGLDVAAVGIALALAAAFTGRAWKEHDWTTLRSLLADDVSFRGPLASIDDAAGCVEGLRRMAQILGRSTGTDSELDPLEHGKITASRVTFDARPFAPPDGD
jgi:hypothetical protein